MNKIDPRLFAIGAGSVVGVNTLATDNDPLAIATGLAIGGGTGALMNLSTPDDLDMRAQRSINNTRRSIDPTATTGRAQTFDELKRTVKDMATNLAKSSTSTATDFSRDNPFSTLNKNTFQDFTRYLDSMVSEESLKELQLAFQLKDDSSFVDTNSVSGITTNKRTETKISDTAKLKTKMKFLEDEFKRLGYSGQDLDEKLLKFEGLVKNHDGFIKINDGVLDLKGVGKIKLTQTIGSGAEKATVFVNNRNMYDVKQVNLFGKAMLGDNIDSKAIADALGIVSADLFDLNAQLTKVAGMAPDDAIAMMADKLNPQQLKEFISKMEGSYNFNEMMSGQLKYNILNGINAPIKPSQFSIANSNTVDYGTSLNFVDNNSQLAERAFGNIGVVSKDGSEMAEMKQLTRKLSQMTGEAFYGVSADHVTQLPATGSVTNQPASVHAPLERNPNSVNNRLVVSTLNNKVNSAIEKAVEALGGQQTFASAIAIQSYSVDPEGKLTDVLNSKRTVGVMDLVARMFGSDKATGDGYGLANRNITNNITSEGYSNSVIKPNSNNKYTIVNEAMRKHISGQLPIGEMRKQALEGSIKFSTKTEKALLTAKDRLGKIEEAVNNKSASDIFDILKNEHKSFKKYGSYADYLASNKKLAGSADQVQYMADIAKKTILGKALSGDSLYTQKFKDYAHFDVIKSISKVDKELSKLQKAVSSSKFSDATSIINDLLSHNDNAKLHTDAFEAYFPKMGSVIGYTNDMSEVAVKESYRFLEFQGAMRVLDETDKNTSEAIQFMYKGMNRAGFETISKSFGTSSKEQLKHLEGTEFSKIGFFLSNVKEGRIQLKGDAFEITLANTAKPITLSQKAMKGDIIEELTKAGATKADLNMAKKTLSFFSKNVGTISEDGGSGMKNAEDLYERLKQFKAGSVDESAIKEKFVTDNLMAKHLIEKVSSGNLTENQLKGLSNFAVATSRDRASVSYLLTTMASIEMTSDLKVSNYTNAAGGTAQQNALSALRSFASDILGDDSFLQGNFDMNSFKQKMAAQTNWLKSMYDNGGAVHEMYQDPSIMNRLSGIFMAERTYRSNDIGDSLIQMSSFNRRAEAESGSGSTDKRMSWNVQTQLKMNGITDEELDAFGKFNVHNIADLESVLSIRARDALTVNDQITDANIKDFNKALVQSPTKRREALAAAGVKIDGLSGAYQLSAENKMGFRNIPIVLENSALFGTYVNEHNEIAEKKVSQITAQIIQNDLSLRRTDMTEHQRQNIQKIIEKDVEHLANYLRPSLGGQDNILKKAQARDAINSRYSTMVPVSGQLNDMAAQQKSVVSVSSEGLIQRFKQLGYKYNSIDEIEQAGHLRKEGSLMKVFIDQKNDLSMFGIINREPATGPGSARFVEYYLDKTLTNDAKSLHVAANDQMYKYFQFGDFDLDHTLEYMPDFKNKQYDTEFLKKMLEKGTKVNQSLFDLKEYASMLGVKGSTKGKIGSLFDVYEQHGGKFSSTQDWMTKYVEDEIIAKQKGGDRKSVSPTVTKLAADINDSIARAGDTSGVATQARVLSHYFVENLLKSQHIDNAKYGKMTTTMAEQLQAYMSRSGDITRSKFIQEFTNYIEDTAMVSFKEKLQGDPEKLNRFMKETQAAIALIADNLRHDPDRGPITPMHQSAPTTAERVGDSIDDLRKSVTPGQGAAVQIHPLTEELINDANEMSLAQKGKLGYYKTLENLKHNFGNNKKLLAAAGAATIGAALLTQKKPDFGDSRAEANPSGMLMAPSKSIMEDSARDLAQVGGVQRAVDYIRPYKRDNSYVGIEASYGGGSGNMDQDINHFIFGDGLSSARVVNM